MAAAPPDPGTVIYMKDWLTLAALLLGPVCAVGITLWHQNRVEKRSAKRKLFVALMAHRKSIPIATEWAQSLNIIDVVFADNPKVVGLYHTLYNVLTTPPLDMVKLQHSRLELLSAMAASLGYKALQQTDIDKFYVPQAHTDQAGRQGDLQTEFLRVLKASKSFSKAADE